MYDPSIVRFPTIDPISETYYNWSPYIYGANNPIRYEDTNGEGPGDKVLGFAAAVVDNALGGLTNFRTFAANYVSKGGVTDFNFGQDAGDVISILGGIGMIEGGTGAAVSGTLITAGTGGLGVEVGAPVAVGGILVAAEGAILAGSGAKNLGEQKGRVNADSGENNSSLGTRRQNRIPDSGTPNSTATNKSGTTVKKYGPDGYVQKEFNKGHQGNKVPKNERKDHIHDHKPKPNRHPNDPQATERQPGRSPKKNELKKDFDL